MHAREEINVTEDRRIILKIDKSNNGLFEKINEIDYLLASLTKIKEGSHGRSISETKEGPSLWSH